MEENAMDHLFRGCIDRVQDRKSNAVRVFISSTFTDTVEERDGLILSVYPKLRSYCQQTYQTEFQYTDMRWGVQDQAWYDHSTVDTCLKELARCCQSSLATNCIVFLSHRYGSRIVPARIKKSIFQELEQVMSTENCTLLNQAYRMDENMLDPIYILQPIDPSAKKEWKATSDQLLTALREAADRCCFENRTMSERDRNDFHISVTAKEIYQALEMNQDQAERMAVFIRDIEDLPNFDEKLKAKFMDTTDDSESLLKDLKNTLGNALPAGNIFKYRVRWLDQSSKTKYLARFQEDIFALMKRQIDYHMGKMRKTNDLYDEVLEHAMQCQRLHERYFPRENLLKQIRDYVLSDERKPCIIYGESGTGKSSMMAELVFKIFEWLHQSTSVSIIFRFFGTTAWSGDSHRFLISIIEQISAIYRLETPAMHESSTSHELKTIFEQILHRIPSNERLFLVLDSIDQLRVEDYDCSQWIPVDSPSNVKWILSTIPTISDTKHDPPMIYRILDGLKSLFGDVPLIHVTEFDENAAMEVFQSWLERDRRRLTPLQMSWLQPKLQPHLVYRGLYETDAEPTALFLSLIYDITLHWHSYDDQVDEDFQRIETTSTAIQYLYRQLAKKHNEVFFKRAIGYLYQAGGLSEIELEDLLSADNEVLKSIFVHYLPPLNIFRVPSSLWVRLRNDMQKYLTERNVDNTSVIYFYHRSFQEYEVLDAAETKSVELIRCAYFAGQVDGYLNLNEQPFEIQSRKLIERNKGIASIQVDRRLTPLAPYHSFDREHRVHRFNLRRIHQLCRCIDHRTLEPLFLYDYQFMIGYLHCYKMTDRFVSRSTFPSLRFLLMIYQSISKSVERYPNNFAFEILLRLLPLVDVLPDRITNLVHQCRTQCALQPMAKQLNASDLDLHRRSIGEVRALSTSIHCVFILLPQTLLIIRTSINAWAGRYEEYPLPSNDLYELKTHPEFVCVYAPHIVHVFACLNKHQWTLEIPVNQLLHVDFVLKNALLVCSKTSSTIEIWSCLTMRKIGQYAFDDSPAQCSTVLVIDGVVIRVTLNNHATHYIHAKATFDAENIATAVTFKPISVLSERIDTASVFFNAETDVHYTEGNATLMFYHYKRAEAARIEPKEALPVIDQRPFSRQFFFRRMHSALIWLSANSIVIYHSCGNHSIIPGQYRSVDGPCDLSIRTACVDTLTCLHLNGLIIDVYQWQCQDNQHSYRLLSRLHLDQEIDRYACCIGMDHGITMYCVLNHGELRHYNLTMINDLPKHCFKPVGKRMFNERIGSLQIQGDFLVVLDETNCYLQLFHVTNELNFVLRLRTQNRIAQLAICSSYCLLFCTDDTLLLYRIQSTPKLLFTHENLRVDSSRIFTLDSSFFILDGQKNELYQIEIGSSSQLRLLTRFNSKVDLRLIAVQPERHQCLVVSRDHRSLMIWNHLDQTFDTRSLPWSDDVKLERICALPHALIFHDDQCQVHVLDDRSETKEMLFESADLLEVKDNYMALLQRRNARLIIYDVENRWRGHIRLRSALDQLFFTDDQQYLLGISLQKSLLLIYSIKTGQLVEKLFLNEPSPLVTTIANRLVMVRHNDLHLFTLTDKDETAFVKCPSKLTKFPSIFERRNWFDCHTTEPWTKM